MVCLFLQSGGGGEGDGGGGGGLMRLISEHSHTVKRHSDGTACNEITRISYL